jgi:hypothetical protein
MCGERERTWVRHVLQLLQTRRLRLELGQDTLGLRTSTAACKLHQHKYTAVTGACSCPPPPLLESETDASSCML